MNTQVLPAHKAMISVPERDVSLAISGRGISRGDGQPYEDQESIQDVGASVLISGLSRARLVAADVQPMRRSWLSTHTLLAAT